MKHLTAIAAVCVFVVSSVPAFAASASVLHHRESRQVATLHRDRGTLRFFQRHPRLARTPAGRRAVRFARAEIVWTLRELGETRAALRPPAVRSAPLAATASWYGPGLYGNALACGGVLTTGLQGVANLSMPCGAPLLVCYGGRCIATRVVDRGPYVAGRLFDLTGGLAAALGFSGVGTITWRPL